MRVGVCNAMLRVSLEFRAGVPLRVLAFENPQRV